MQKVNTTEIAILFHPEAGFFEWRRHLPTVVMCLCLPSRVQTVNQRFLKQTLIFFSDFFNMIFPSWEKPNQFWLVIFNPFVTMSGFQCLRKWISPLFIPSSQLRCQSQIYVQRAIVWNLFYPGAILVQCCFNAFQCQMKKMLQNMKYHDVVLQSIWMPFSSGFT